MPGALTETPGTNEYRNVLILGQRNGNGVLENHRGILRMAIEVVYRLNAETHTMQNSKKDAKQAGGTSYLCNHADKSAERENRGRAIPIRLLSTRRNLFLFQYRHSRTLGFNNLVTVGNTFKVAFSDITGKKVDSLLPSAFQVHIFEVEIVLDPFLICEFVCHFLPPNGLFVKCLRLGLIPLL